jgi:putative ABC transport system ATP-binding protein
MNQPVMEAIQVAKFLGDGASTVQALKGVSISLAGGELALLMGPSGSGKTTLLSILGCIMSPSEGAIRICGRSTGGLSPDQFAELRRKYIGFVFQSYHLFPALTALDNVRLALDVRGEHFRSFRKAREALAAVGLSHKTNALPRELSGGEQQRVAIARAIVAKPALILADEPTAALDSQNGHSVMSLLAEFASSPDCGVLVVTHDPRILPFASRIIHIEDGHLVGEGQSAQAVQ